MVDLNKINFSEEVRTGLSEKKPIVALETTITSHGMPYPQNVETALEVDKIIRARGAIPAVIGVIKGVIHVGTNIDQLTYFGENGSNIGKASRRDLAIMVANGLDGATTCASTTLIAKMVGIDVFCTGGIGGVHRGAEGTMDISADLDEFGKTPVITVCAGPKAILDIPKTLEYLETKGVPIIGYQTDILPAFFSSTSNYKVDYRIDDVEKIALSFIMQKELGIDTGMLVCVPIPKEYEIRAEEINPCIEEAVIDAEKKHVYGKAATPFLLDRVKQITSGRSLASNIQLVYNNARVAAEIAKSLRMQS